LRMKQWRWERPGVKLRGWLTTEPDGKSFTDALCSSGSNRN
jgi:hypothetical protein